MMAASAVGSTTVLASLQSLLQESDPTSGEIRLITGQEEKIVPGVCLLCPSGCGVLSRVSDGRVVKLEGSPMHPINTGSLCPKGQAAPELLYNPDRVVGPLRRVGERGSGDWEPLDWAEATSLVAQRLSALRDAGEPQRAALMFGEARGQLRSFLKRFMEAIGSPNTISRDSLNVAGAKLAMYLTQGIYDMPAYDLENSDYVLSFGASLLEAGPVPQRIVSGYSYLRQGRATRGKVVIVDPRQGVSGAKADEWIPINPGTDGALALGMAHVIIRAGQIDSSFVNKYSFGYDDFPDESGTRLIQGFKSFVLENYDPQSVEAITGVPAATISRLAGEFAGANPPVAVLPGKGGLLNGTVGGLYAAMAVHCLNALVGSIEQPGGTLRQRYPALRQWPELPDDPIARRGCQADRVDGAGSHFPLGRHAYQAVADHVLDDYPLDVLLLYDANPVFEVPGGERFVDAFRRIPFIVSFSSFLDESAQYADLVLPEPTFLERYEDHFIEGFGYPGVGLRQPVITPRLDTMSVGDFLLRVTREMGGPLAEAFPWQTYQGVLRHRLLLEGADWETLEELGVWMTPGYRFARRGSEKWVNEVVGSDRRNAPRDGYFDFYSRELSCVMAALSEEERNRLGITDDGDDLNLPHYVPTPFVGDEEEYPFMLNIITLMSLGPFSVAANMPTLQEISGMTVDATWDSWVEINPAAARRQRLEDGDEVWVESPFGRVKTQVRIVAALRPDVVNLPYNQGHTAIGRYARDRGVNGLALLNPESEPVTGLAAFTNTRVKITRAREVS